MIIFRSAISPCTVINYDGKRLYQVGGKFIDLKTLKVYHLPQHMRDASFAEIMENQKFESIWQLHKSKFEEEESYFLELHDSDDLAKADFEPLQKLFSTYENFNAISKEQIVETVVALEENPEIHEAPASFIYLFDMASFLIHGGEFYDFFEARKIFCNLPDFGSVTSRGKQLSKQEEICKKIYDIVCDQDLPVQPSVFNALKTMDYRRVMRHCDHLLIYGEPRNLIEELQQLETVTVDPEIVRDALIALGAGYDEGRISGASRTNILFAACIRCLKPLNACEISNAVETLRVLDSIKEFKILLKELEKLKDSL